MLTTIEDVASHHTIHALGPMRRGAAFAENPVQYSVTGRYWASH